MSTYQPYDFSSQSVPESWTEAAGEAPQTDPFAGGIAPGDGPMRVVRGGGMDLSAAIPGTMAALFVIGTMWVLLHGAGVDTPWYAIALGVTAALTVRATAGPRNPGFRGLLAGVMYLVALSVITAITVSMTYADLYGAWPSLAQFEDHLIYVEVRQADSVAAWAVGGILALASSRLTD